MEDLEYNDFTSVESKQVINNPTGEPNIRRNIRDSFLDDEVPEAEVLYPSSMNEADLVEHKMAQPFSLERSVSPNNTPSTLLKSKEEGEQLPFIVANTSEVSLQHLSKDCIIPVFSKDNEKTIAHQEFISTVIDAVQEAFPNHSLTVPEVRVSHQVKGRIPSAVNKNVKELLEHEKTTYYERMAFLVRIPAITDQINGNELSLCIGGVRSYNQENLYARKTLEKFKFFIGFQNRVCMNLCVSTDGFLEDLRVGSPEELYKRSLEVMQGYNAELHLMEMKGLSQDYLSEHQFAQLIGKSRLYQHLPKEERRSIPELTFNDSHINTMAKDYYEDQNFSRMEDGRINLWNVFNLFTQANKSSYIDTFLDRNLNAFEFSKGLQKTLNGNSDYHWFLS